MGTTTFPMDTTDNKAVLPLQLSNPNGSLQPLVGDEVITFNFIDFFGNLIFDLPGSIQNAAQSIVETVIPGSSVTGMAGRVLRVRCQVAFADSSQQTFPTFPDQLLLALY